MFQSNKRRIENDLTRNINNMKLEEVLLHKDLSNSIRNEAEELYNRILLKDNNPWFEQIIQYALFNNPAPEPFKKVNTVNQINHNASSFLDSCGKKFAQIFNGAKFKIKDERNPNKETEVSGSDFLYRQINLYIEKSKSFEKEVHSMTAGHFQRFISNFIRIGILDSDKLLNPNNTNFSVFLVQNCMILAYQQLITRILSDCYDEYNKYSLLTLALLNAVNSVHYIRNQINETNKSFFKSTQQIQNDKDQRENLSDQTQPVNLKKDPIPLIKDIFPKKGNYKDLSDAASDAPNIKWKLVNQSYSKSDFANEEDAEFFAYMLIMSVRVAASDQTEIIDMFRNDQNNNYQLIHSLFYCGTRCSVCSLISLEAFRLLKIIFGGSVFLQVEPWKNTEKEKSELDFYNRFAEDMIFDQDYLTYKMIHALPLFWNHRYNIGDGKNYYKLDEIDVADYYNDGKKHKRKRLNGETALEILQPCLFCDPPVSTQLSNSVTDIFIQLSKKRRSLSLFKDSDLMVEMDGIALDFYTHIFDFGQYPKETILGLIEVIVPLLPNDKFYSSVETKKRRASLNGFTVDFFLRMMTMKTSGFFEYNKTFTSSTNKKTEGLNVSKFAREIIMTETKNNMYEFMEYKDQIGFDILPESTLNNIPIHDDYFFVNDDDDDDDDDEELIEENKNAPNPKVRLVSNPEKYDNNGAKKKRRRKKRKTVRVDEYDMIPKKVQEQPKPKKVIETSAQESTDSHQKKRRLSDEGSTKSSSESKNDDDLSQYGKDKNKYAPRSQRPTRKSKFMPKITKL